MEAVYCYSNILIYLWKQIYQIIIELPKESYYKQSSSVLFNANFLLKWL